MAGRQIKTPGVTESQQPETNENEQASDIQDAVAGTGVTESQVSELSQEDILREQLEQANAVIEQLKSSSKQSTGGFQSKQSSKRVPVLTKDGWTTKESD